MKRELKIVEGKTAKYFAESMLFPDEYHVFVVKPSGRHYEMTVKVEPRSKPVKDVTNRVVILSRTTIKLTGNIKRKIIKYHDEKVKSIEQRRGD